jgi:carotenoid 1,2-hydratase
MTRTAPGAGVPFDTPVAPGGYRWWYVDGFDDAHECAITVIAFVGSVFSPAYLRARRRDAMASPEAHCGLNVVVHGPSTRAWSMNELSSARVQRSADRFTLRASTLSYDADGLDIEIDEPATLWGSRIRGRVRVRPRTWHNHEISLDLAASHRWIGIAPCADVEVDLEHPRLGFRGRGYHDGNAGTEGLEQGFVGWTWSRTATTGGVAVTYDVHERGGRREPRGLRFTDDGGVGDFDAPVSLDLPPSRWRLPRRQRVESGDHVEVVRTLVDAPFYARTVTMTTGGVERFGMHEVVDLDRFVARRTQWMLPFKIAGAGWW